MIAEAERSVLVKEGRGLVLSSPVLGVGPPLPHVLVSWKKCF